jgi:2'-5' RNA ligase
VSRFALVVPFRELAPVVDGLRERTCISKPSHGMPPHVTLLSPSPDDAAAIAGALSGFAPFNVTFARLNRFPGTLWLEPEPSRPFVRMIETLTARFPDRRPYGGTFAEVVPHLTVAQSDFETAVHKARAWLPLRVEALQWVLFAEAEPNRRRAAATFAFGTV